jgi:hypothetical protein
MEPVVIVLRMYVHVLKKRNKTNYHAKIDISMIVHAGKKVKNTKTNQITIAKNQKYIFTLVTYKDFSFYEKYA